MLDVYIEKYRLYIGSALILIIIVGIGLLWQNKSRKVHSNQENQIIAELTKQNENLRKELSGQLSSQVAGESTNQDQSDKININTSDAIELDKLPDVGPVRAQDIIAYRESHGGFKTIEEIKNIKGIGDKTFESMKDLITIGDLSN